MKKRQTRLLKPVGILLGSLLVVMALGFTERSTDRAPVVELRVQVDAPQGVHFIDAAAVRERVMAIHTGIVGAPMGDVPVAGIERELRSVPCVASADLYRTFDGVLHVNVKQRRPIVRVLNADGSSFYIDADGHTMPVSEVFTARVLVTTGALAEPFTSGVHRITADDSLAEATRSDEILRLARFITADPRWSALIDQVVVDASGEMELIPRVGVQRIAIGGGEQLEQRFAKLASFYDGGITQGGWRTYSRIDLRFADQVVATRRGDVPRTTTTHQAQHGPAREH
jgi:cell division protein FtsQ